jgi:protein O-GlcNAc transferase
VQPGPAGTGGRTPEEYVAIAVQLAGDLPRLQELRATLRERMRASPLMDGKRFARHMEQAFRQMWRKWCLRQQGKLIEAVDHFRTALLLKPDFPNAHHSLGNSLREQGKLDEAVDCYHKALQLKPDVAGAYSNLGNALRDQGKLDEAVNCYRRALQLEPGLADAHNNLGSALHDQGKLEEAVDCYRRALRLKPDLADAHNNLGSTLQDQGKLEEAVNCYRRALQLEPGLADAHNNLGSALHDQGKLEEAVDCYRRALRLKPDLADAHNNLGSTLQDQGKLEEAVDCHRRTLQLKPDFADAHNNLGNALRDQGKLAEAVDCFHRALQQKPDYAVAHNNLGNALRDQGKLEEAVDCHRRALRLKPDYAVAINNLGNALWDQGKLEEAVDCHRRALQLKPESATIHDRLVFTLHYHPDYDSAALYQEARRWNDQHAEPLAKFRRPHENTVDPERRLRIGYVSPDFRNHPVAHCLAPLFSNHDHRRLEIFCYSEVARPDQVTERLRAYADVWRVTVRLTDEQMAEMVRADQIDILVDLALHTANNRLLVFARKPAPVQISWLGYAGTTGVSTIDYRLTDPYLDPPGETDSCYSEASIRLPDTFWCYDPLDDQPVVNDLPALASDSFNFGCLNDFRKVNDGVLMLWAKVLRAVPGARLLLYAPRGRARDHVLAILGQHGIAELRVEFIDRQPRQRYLQMYNRIDLGLDLLPFNGGVTSLNAFWMGVPIVTLIGKTVVGRAGWSQLCNLGLPELAARTPEEYVGIAVRLAGDLPRLRELRATLRNRMQASPLMDGKRFAGHMEQAYRQMWRKWCHENGTTEVS